MLVQTWLPRHCCDHLSMLIPANFWNSSIDWNVCSIARRMFVIYYSSHLFYASQTFILFTTDFAFACRISYLLSSPRRQKELWQTRGAVSPAGLTAGTATGSGPGQPADRGCAGLAVPVSAFGSQTLSCHSALCHLEHLRLLQSIKGNILLQKSCDKTLNLQLSQFYRLIPSEVFTLGVVWISLTA